MKALLQFMIVLLMGTSQLLRAEPCYVVVDQAATFQPSVVQSMASAFINQYIQPVSNLPSDGAN